MFTKRYATNKQVKKFFDDHGLRTVAATVAPNGVYRHVEFRNPLGRAYPNIHVLLVMDWAPDRCLQEARRVIDEHLMASSAPFEVVTAAIDKVHQTDGAARLKADIAAA